MKFIALFLSFLLVGCISVPVYVHDKHTVMEMESSAKWEDLDEEFSGITLKQGSQQLSDVPKSLKDKKSFAVLNGEFYQQKEE